MGFWHTAYAAYGIALPKSIDLDTVEQYVDQLDNEVGHLNAGPYDRDSLYLVTACASAELGQTECIPVEATSPGWDEQLRAAAVGLGVPADQVPTPGWFVVADMS